MAKKTTIYQVTVKGYESFESVEVMREFTKLEVESVLVPFFKKVKENESLGKESWRSTNKIVEKDGEIARLVNESFIYLYPEYEEDYNAQRIILTALPKDIEIIKNVSIAKVTKTTEFEF